MIYSFSHSTYHCSSVYRNIYTYMGNLKKVSYFVFYNDDDDDDDDNENQGVGGRMTLRWTLGLWGSMRRIGFS